jgi:hypothetical protein
MLCGAISPGLQLRYGVYIYGWLYLYNLWKSKLMTNRQFMGLFIWWINGLAGLADL